MGFNLNLTGETISEGSSFDPLAPGKYAVTVYDITPKEYGSNTANAGRDSWNVQFRIEDGQTGANRRVFQQVGLFPSWAPTEKNPSGSDNFLFYQFFSAVLGISEKEFRAQVKEAAEGKGKKVLSLPNAEDILGKSVVLILGIENDTWNYNKAVNEGTLLDDETQDDYKRNNIKRILAVGAASGGSAKGGGKAKEEVIRL